MGVEGEGAVALSRYASLSLGMLLCAVGLRAQDTAAVHVTKDSLTVRFVQADIRAVIQALGRYLPKPVLVTNIPPVPVSLETPTPVPRAAVPALLKGLVESQSLELTEDSTYFRVAPRPAEGARPSAGPLTRPGQGEGPVQLFVIRLKHARAADVAATVNLLFGAGGEFSGRAGLSTGTLSDELRRNVVPPVGAPQAAAPAAGPPVRPSALSGAVTIVPDELTNSLLIRASGQDFDVLQQAVDQLDIRPLQVLIEVLIIEARKDRHFALGTSLFVPPQGVDKGNGTVDARVTGASVGDLVIRLMNLEHAEIVVTLTAASSRVDVQIVSRPVLLASILTEARFLVGTQRRMLPDRR